MGRSVGVASTYNVPEIVVVPIEIGLDKYLQWVAQLV